MAFNLLAYMPDLRGKSILLGVTGGVAAYKAVELVRMLNKCGARVRVAMTQSATEFVAPLTFQAISGERVACGLWEGESEGGMDHIALADESDAVVIAPATANSIAKLACGIADDLLSTICLTFDKQILLAPAMNVRMWQNPATQANVKTVTERGMLLVGPGKGEQACGMVGPGRMVEPAEIAQAVGWCVAPQDLKGKKVLVAAGPTREAIDPVRFLSNPSTGKMGYCLAAEAVARGATVTLVSGPTSIEVPIGVALTSTTSAAEMADAVLSRADEQDIVVMAAAVADYTPGTRAAEKLKKRDLGKSTAIELRRTADILAALGERRKRSGGKRPMLIGFAAETASGLAETAKQKRAEKNCDIIVANPIGKADSGFGADTNRVVICTADGRTEELALASKRAIAAKILDAVENV